MTDIGAEDVEPDYEHCAKCGSFLVDGMCSNPWCYDERYIPQEDA